MTIARATLLFAGYALVTLALTHPIAWHLAEVPHDMGDPLLSTVVLWWNAHHLPLSPDWWNGSFFFPSTGTLSFSDHRLGVSLIASPLQWAGVSPLVATNLTLLALFPLCALAAHWLAYTLTDRHDAALVAGLAYGFNPYRFAHIEHLELLAAFGMPVALVALHRHLADRRRRWLVLFGVAILLQALTCSYYFLFFAVMLALWTLWFVRRNDLGVAFGAALAALLVVLAMGPVAYQYVAIHDRYGLRRIYREIVTLSADVTSIVTASPSSVLWGWTSSLNGPERQLFPGATVVVLVAAAIVVALRAQRGGRPRNAVSHVALVVALVFTSLALVTLIRGPWHLGAISIGTPFKTFSLAFYALVIAILGSSPVRDAFRRRSIFAFYALAAAALFVFALGPAPAFLHHQILYEPPYAWLMRLGVFQRGVRVPARFGMLVALALTTAAALAFDRLVPRGRRAAWVAACVVCIAILADAWTRPIPMLVAPATWPSSVSTAGVTSVLELPLGETTHDVAAMYRSVLTNIPSVNGYSGYFPPHYEPLRLALEERDETALSVLAARGPLLVVVERGWPYARERLQWLRALDGASQATPTATEIASNEEYVWFVVNPSPPQGRVACGGSLPIAAARDWRRDVDLRPVADDNDATFWSSGTSQRAGDALSIDLGEVARPCSIRLTLGSHGGSYPRALKVLTSTDQERWETRFEGKLGGLAVAAVLDHPLNAALELNLSGLPARYIQLQLAANQPEVAWLVTELAVTASKPE